MLGNRHALGFVAASACLLGGGGAIATAAATRTGSTSTWSGSDSRLAQLLPTAGEMPGFRMYGPILARRTIGADVRDDPAGLRKSDSANLLKDGFQIELVRNWTSTTGRVGATSGFTQLRSHRAAAAYDQFTFGAESQPGPVAGSASEVRIARFRVPGVAGTKGVTFTYPRKGFTDADVQWVQGSCLIQLGDANPGTTVNTATLIHAARAIHQRTQGVCPANTHTVKIG